jgi:hypothetical protein
MAPIDARTTDEGSGTDEATVGLMNSSPSAVSWSGRPATASMTSWVDKAYNENNVIYKYKYI